MAQRARRPASPPCAEILDGYGAAGCQASGPDLPAAGCRHVTGGRVGEASLTFVVLVTGPAASTTAI